MPRLQVLAGHEDDPGPSALALRLLGSVHRLVLERRAPELALFYPSVGGTWDLDGGWAAFERLLVSSPDDVREWLDRPPQTNEVGRAGALMGGLLSLGHRLPVRLFEIGSSGGLNLLADRFAYVDSSGTTYGDPAAVVRLDGAWQGRPLRPWPDLEIVERVGSDVMPVDVATTEGRLTLTAYVWPDQTARHERLRGALALAAADARRGTPPGRGLVRGGDRAARGDDHGAVAQRDVAVPHRGRTRPRSPPGSRRSARRPPTTAPFAHLFLEPTRRTPDTPHEFLVVLTEWPSGERRILGDSAGHGLPTTWE